MTMTETARKEGRPREGGPKDSHSDKPQQNIQDVFLNNLRRDRAQVTVFLVGGVKLTGRIKSFDKYAVLLETNTHEQLIFKHAISTVSPAKGGSQPSRPEPPSHPAAPSEG